MNSESLESDILERLFQPKVPFATEAAAQFFLTLEFGDEDKHRMGEIAAKARAGQLTAEDQAAIEAYTRVGCWISILKSKARTTLKAPGARKHTKAGTNP